MKAALIPPRGYESTVLASDYHLMLAQVTHYNYIQRYCSLPVHDFIILDNGAAEGATVPDGELLDLVVRYGVNEVVVPDAMKDSSSSKARAYQFFERAKVVQLHPSVSFMLVAQGTDFEEVKKHVDWIANEFPLATIGLPRHLLTTLNALHARKAVLNYILDNYGQKNVHLLGTNPVWIGEIRMIQEFHPWVRGVDTSAPYNYAMLGDALDADVRVQRLPDYFTEYREMDQQLLDRNIKTYLEWAHGTEGTRS